MKNLLLGLTLGMCACVCSRQTSTDDANIVEKLSLATAQAFTIDQKAALQSLEFVAQAAHPFGSARQQEVLAYLESKAKDLGIQTYIQRFQAEVPNPKATAEGSGPASVTLSVDGANLYAWGAIHADAPCIVLLASHFDTKIVPGIDYLGANDSGSSSVLLIEIMRHFHGIANKEGFTCDIGAVWFDGEESYLENWHDGETQHPARTVDHTYGSRHAASLLTSCTFDGRPYKCLPEPLGSKPLAAVILMDMIGSPEILLTDETQSSSSLKSALKTAADSLGLRDHLGGKSTSIEDDHAPFLKAGVTAIDLIDFEHLTHWHKDSDVPANVSLNSVEKAGKLASYLAARVARAPQVFQLNTEK